MFKSAGAAGLASAAASCARSPAAEATKAMGGMSEYLVCVQRGASATFHLSSDISKIKSRAETIRNDGLTCSRSGQYPMALQQVQYQQS